MFKNKQAELILKLSPKEIVINLYLTQLLFLVVAIILSYFFYNDILFFTVFLKYEPIKNLLLGVGTSILVVLLDILMWRFLPKSMVDDGGINDKIFSSLKINQIFVITLVIAFCEEILFRGTLQPTIGLFWTSIIFAVMHIRYLNKPILIGSALIVSFLLGWLFELSGNLSTTVIAHFLIDFILGLLLRLKPFTFLR